MTCHRLARAFASIQVLQPLLVVRTAMHDRRFDDCWVLEHLLDLGREVLAALTLQDFCEFLLQRVDTN